jgi:hypothetical protein
MAILSKMVLTILIEFQCLQKTIALNKFKQVMSSEI